MTKTVCMFVTNNVTRDPRVKREAGTLVKGGYQVVVIGVAAEGDSPEEWLEDYRVIRIQRPVLVRPREVFINMRLAMLFALKRRWPGLYEALRKCYRAMHRTPASGARPQAEAAPQRVAQNGARTFREQLYIDQIDIRTIFWLNLAMAKIAVQLDAALYHAHDLDTLLAGYLAKRRTGKLLVYDFHELYTEQFQPGSKTPLWHLWYSILERILVKRADFRLTVCDSLGEWVSRRYGVDRAVTVMNVPIVQDPPLTRGSRGRDKVILYHGGYTPDRGLEQLVESVRYLRDGRIVFRGYGQLEERLRELVKENGVDDRVAFEPPVPVTELVRSATEAAIGVIPYVPVCLNNRFCLPNKIFEYMMAGLALAGSDLPELKRIILGHNLGAVFNPEDPRDIARALNELLADEVGLEKMRSNARVASRALFNWDHEGQKLLRVYDSALGVHRVSAA